MNGRESDGESGFHLECEIIGEVHRRCWGDFCLGGYLILLID